MHTYYLRSFGCQMNAHDAERIRALLEERGLAPVAEPDMADLLVYNTCTIRRSADDRLAGHLGSAARLKREAPERVVIVTGCLPQAEQDAFFRRFPYVDGALGPQNLHRLPDLLESVAGDTPAALTTRGYFADGANFSGDLPSRRERPYQAWVQIMSGCTNFCSYCIVPHVRGPERSRGLDAIVSEVTDLVSDGVREVTLLGQNVNAYGHDFRPGTAADKADFSDLLRALDALPGMDRIRFMTSHPRDLSDRLVDTLQELPSVCEHVHLPVQAGSDSVLRAMNRGYTAAQYLDRVHALRAAIPGVSITTDLIAGFPGETEDDFKATLELVREAGFDSAFTFVFSPRSGTPAADLAGQVDEEVKVERVQRLVELTQRLALQSHQRLIGSSVEVLLEGPSRDGRLLRGRTRQNLTVNVTGAACPGAIVKVKVTEATSTTLRGRL
jgi:tRNA-2-methylthio-N6-dimethylallyladenosine synthase